MSNLMIKNGYNGSHRRYAEQISKETRQKFVCDSKRSLHFPAIIRQDKQTSHQQEKPKSPQNRAVVFSPESDGLGFDYSSYSPSLIQDDSSDCMILFQDEITELRHLVVSLGIDVQYKSRSLFDREVDSRWSPVKESKGEEWWKNSKRWTKRNDEEIPNGHMCKTYKPSVTAVKTSEGKNKELEKYKGKKDEYDDLPESVKRNIRSVEIPGIGCSYRLPTISKKQKKY